MKQPVEGHPNLLKDPETGVIINQDDSERSKYRLARNQARMNQNNSIELETLRDEIDEIKSLLKQLLNK
jgi:Tfp pilus assembly protein PilO